MISGMLYRRSGQRSVVVSFISHCMQSFFSKRSRNVRVKRLWPSRNYPHRKWKPISVAKKIRNWGSDNFRLNILFPQLLLDSEAHAFFFQIDEDSIDDLGDQKRWWTLFLSWNVCYPNQILELAQGMRYFCEPKNFFKSCNCFCWRLPRRVVLVPMLKVSFSVPPSAVVY